MMARSVTDTAGILARGVGCLKALRRKSGCDFTQDDRRSPPVDRSVRPGGRDHNDEPSGRDKRKAQDR